MPRMHAAALCHVRGDNRTDPDRIIQFMPGTPGGREAGIVSEDFIITIMIVGLLISNVTRRRYSANSKLRREKVNAWLDERYRHKLSIGDADMKDDKEVEDESGSDY